MTIQEFAHQFHTTFDTARAHLDRLVRLGIATVQDGDYILLCGERKLSLHPRVTDVTRFDTVRFNTLEQLLPLFKHRDYARKEDAELFVPAGYVRAECRHRSDRPHKCNMCVNELSLCVFDMDQGNAVDVAYCLEKLKKRKIAYIAYTTFSYPEKEAWRLILFPSENVPAEYWKPFRTQLINQYVIPCDPRTSCATSHGYYLPAKKAGADFRLLASVEDAFEVEFAKKDLRAIAYNRFTMRQEGDSIRGIKEKPGKDPARIAEFREILNRAKERMSARNCLLLMNLLAGRALAPKGGRRQALWNTCALVKATAIRRMKAYTIEEYEDLFCKSLDAMIAEGSSVTRELLVDNIYRAGNNPSGENE